MEKEASSLKEFATQFVIQGKAGFAPRDFLNATKKVVVDLMNKNQNTKVKMALSCQMSRVDLTTGEVFTREATFHSLIEKNFVATDRSKLFNKMRERIIENKANFQTRGSNWRFTELGNLTIFFVKYRSLRAGHFMKLLAKLKNKKGIINMKNTDEQCFKFCVTRALFPVKEHPERITAELRKQAETLNWSGISFPTPFNEISKFEQNNPGLAVNVFGFEDGEVFPIRPSEEKGKMIDLFWFKEGKNTHFCLIKDFNRLVSSQVHTKNSFEIFRRCITKIPADDKRKKGTILTAAEKLERHLESCGKFDFVKTVMPEPGSKQNRMKFQNFNRKMEFPFVIFADFECRQEPISSVQPDPR